MMGWMLFGTLLILVCGYAKDSSSGLGNAFGYPESGTNWTIIFILILVIWIVFLASHFGLIHFWFEDKT